MLRRFLPNVIAYTQQADIEIVVADNGIHEKNAEILCALCKEYKFLRVIPADRLGAYFKDT